MKSSSPELTRVGRGGEGGITGAVQQAQHQQGDGRGIQYRPFDGAVAANLQALIEKGFQHSVADTTRRKQETSVRHWITYTETELKIPSLLTYQIYEGYGLFSNDEMANRRLLILGYVARMVSGQGEGLRRHEKEATIKTYVSEINAWHLHRSSLPLIPEINYRNMMQQITKVARGLIKFNDKSPWKRRGLRGTHVKLLNDYTMSKLLNTRIAFAGVEVTLTLALVCNVNALRTFCWQQVCRMGEATTVEQAAWHEGAPFEVGKRPSRAHVMGDHVDRRADQSISQFRIPAFQLKVDNLHSDADFTVPVQSGPDIRLDAGTDLVQMLEVDFAVDDPTITPLFRFPPGCSATYTKSRKSTWGGTDPLSNRTLTAAFIMQLDRMIIGQHPLSFEGIQPMNVGGHSYRIGTPIRLQTPRADPMSA